MCEPLLTGRLSLFYDQVQITESARSLDRDAARVNVRRYAALLRA